MLFRAFFALLLLAWASFALPVDSLPVWHDSLVQKSEIPESDSVEYKFPSQLETSGSKTISVVVGDGGTEIDQELRLSMRGYATENVYIDAFLSDVGRSAGDQNTATLQEVDQVYFRVEAPWGFLHLGDLEWKEDEFGFLGINRKTLGVMGGIRTEHSEVKGTFGVDETEHHFVTFHGVDGQREGYVVGGASLFLSLVPESETVYLNGKKLERGKDYEMNYAGGIIDFKGTILPSSEDEIRIEYDAYQLGETSRIMGAEGKYRSDFLWLDVGGFRLESDVEKLKRASFDSLTYELLKEDKGGDFELPDSTPVPYRPFRTDKASARMRFAYENLFIDLETAFYKKDSNTVSPFVNGPSGRAFSWNIQSDSSRALSRFPLMLGYSGSYLENGFSPSDFSGNIQDYDSYHLQENWDMDSVSSLGKKRVDLLTLRYRLGSHFFGGAEWGYREHQYENSNSMRSRIFMEHFGRISESSLSLIYVAAEDSISSKRYQGILETGIHQGFVRPYAVADYSYWDKKMENINFSALRLRHTGGFILHGDQFEIKEELGGRSEHRKSEGVSWKDSLRQVSWTQTAETYFEDFTLQHLIQYKQTELEESGTGNAWLSSQTLKFDRENLGFYSSFRYDFGLTKEQPYVAIYKPVASGTGDVLLDSTTGLFIEGVDNGDFVYEGMGRSDSLAVEASHAEIEFSFEWAPAKLFKIQNGFLKDITLAFDLRAESYDTTGTKLFFPAFTPSKVQEITSGLYYGEFDLGWYPLSGKLALHYYPGTEYEKKDLYEIYTQDRFWHRISGGYYGRAKEIWNLEGLYENAKLRALVDFDWEVWEGYFSWNRKLPKGFYVEPGVKIRYAEGDDGENFDAVLKEGALKIGYLWGDKAEVFVRGSAIHLESSIESLPYSLMDGYDHGVTYRVEANGEISLGNYLSLGTRYLLRFGESEKKAFQKWTMEARAYL